MKGYLLDGDTCGSPHSVVEHRGQPLSPNHSCSFRKCVQKYCYRQKKPFQVILVLKSLKIILHNLVGMAQFGFLSFGMVKSGLVWLDMVWFGLVCFGMIWFGMVWFPCLQPPAC